MTRLSWLYGKLLGGCREVTDSCREWSPSLFQLVSVTLLPHKCLPTPCSPSLCPWGGYWQVGVSLGGCSSQKMSLIRQVEEAESSIHRPGSHYTELPFSEKNWVDIEKPGVVALKAGPPHCGMHQEKGMKVSTSKPANTTSYEQQALCQLPERLELNSLPLDYITLRI